MLSPPPPTHSQTSILHTTMLIMTTSLLMPSHGDLFTPPPPSQLIVTDNDFETDDTSTSLIIRDCCFQGRVMTGSSGTITDGVDGDGCTWKVQPSDSNVELLTVVVGDTSNLGATGSFKIYDGPDASGSPVATNPAQSSAHLMMSGSLFVTFDADPSNAMGRAFAGFSLVYSPIPKVTYMHPQAIMQSQSAEINVFGSNFVFSSTLMCSISSIWMDAVYMGPSHIKCSLPSNLGASSASWNIQANHVCENIGGGINQFYRKTTSQNSASTDCQNICANDAQCYAYGVFLTLRCFVAR